jgi:sugar-specific transcriptional regulator TrmB
MTSRSEELYLPAEVVERFPADASQDVKRAFASNLVEALNRVNCSPGEKFVVMREADLDTEREAHRDEIKILQEEVEVERTNDMHARRVREMVEDHARGIVTIDEITEYATRG